MSLEELKYLIGSDLYRYIGNKRMNSFLVTYFMEVGFIYSFWMRLSHYLAERSRLVSLPARLTLWHYQTKFGISISHRTQIGSGLYIGHFGGIVVNDKAVIGRNCNISHGVTIGQMNRGDYKGCPILGDGVFIGAGAKIIGSVHVGNNVAIGANCVVTKDVPDNSVVVGVPGKVISYQGSTQYINRIDYD